MNTDKTVESKFIENIENPIWYYKELQEVELDYVIFYLLKENFVVDIDGKKHEIVFGKNRKGEIGQYIRYDDLGKSDLCSYQVIRKGLKEGKWFIVTDKDTSNEFKVEYDRKKAEYERSSTKEMFMSILKGVISKAEDLSEEQKTKWIEDIESSSYEQLERLISRVMQSEKK